MKFIIDEDLSPRVARYLCQEFCFDAIAVRDRGLLGATDPEVLEYAFKEDRILVTANIRDDVEVFDGCSLKLCLFEICFGRLLNTCKHTKRHQVMGVAG
jgi:hypothetical protein